MALDYFAPGVYIEEVDRGSRPIEGVSMSVAGFIGFTEDIRGDARLFEPQLITSWEQFLQSFGQPRSSHPGFTEFNAYLPFAVRGWFDNGGGRCWVVSIGTLEPKPKKSLEEESADASNENSELPRIIKKTRISSSANRPVMALSMKPPGAIATTTEQNDSEDSDSASDSGSDSGSELIVGEHDRIHISIEDSTPKNYHEDTNVPFNTGEFFQISVKCKDQSLGVYEHLTMKEEPSDDADYVVTALQCETRTEEHQSKIDELLDNDPATQAKLEKLLTPLAYQYLNVETFGNNRHPLTRRPKNGIYEVTPSPHRGYTNTISHDLQGSQAKGSGIEGLFEIDEVSMVACPDLMLAYERGWLELTQVHLLMERMLSLCENSFPGPSYRMAVLDAPPVKYQDDSPIAVSPKACKPQHVEKWLKKFNRRSMFGALYYPWIQVANPANEGKPMLVPPCGHMMGLWCRTDESRGVFKAPANDTPRGVTGLAYDTNFREQELLNPKGINCIRNFDNFDRGFKVWGARTLVEPDNIQWRYISVRRLCSYIEKSIERGTQWVVFEPNDSDLWARVTRTVTGFLTGLWRDGALFGASPNDAFYVKCDADNNTHETMMKGRLHIDIGVCPVRPAEFVIFRISQWDPTQEQG